jgi:cytidylate kinase
VLRNEEVGGLASRVSVHPAVRAALYQRQVDLANQPGGAVLDGRDIGTVIAPHADVKLFVTASAEVRALRRYEEMLSRGLDVDYANILADIRKRDERDSGRAEAPLKPAHNAILLDTGDLTIGAAVRKAIELVDTRIENRSS